MKQSYFPYRDPKSYGFILPAPVLQSVPREGAKEIKVNAELRIMEGWEGINKRHTVIQKTTKQRVVALIVFTEAQE